VKEPDWNAEAIRMADYVAEQMFEAHRGAMPWIQSGIAVAFGNDGYQQDKRTKQEAQFLRTYCELKGIPVLGFATTDDDYTWTMLIHHPDHKQFIPVLWAGWNRANGDSADDVFTYVQASIADRAMVESGTKPETSAN
jgi:hypothetical protein